MGVSKGLRGYVFFFLVRVVLFGLYRGLRVIGCERKVLMFNEV